MKIIIGKNKIITSHTIAIILMLFIFCSPDFFMKNEMFNTSITFLKFVLSVLAISVLLIKRKSVNVKLIRSFIMPMAVYFVIKISSTIINSGDIFTVITTSITTLGAIIVTGFLLKNNEWSFFKTYILYFAFIIIINWLFLILYPDGFRLNSDGYRFNFLGIDNNTTQYILVVVCGLFVIKNSIKSQYRFLIDILIAISVFQIFWLEVGTGIIGVLLLIILITLDKYAKIKIFLKPQFYLLMAMFVFVFIVLFRLNNFFIAYLSDVLNKDITFSGRTTIWGIVLTHITEHPIIGYGIQSTDIVTMITKIERSYSPAAHAHCQYLQIMIESGIFSLVSVYFILAKTFKLLAKCWFDVKFRILLYGIVTFIIVSMVEVMFYDFFWMFLFVAYYLAGNSINIFGNGYKCNAK